MVDRINSEHNAELKRVHREYRETEEKVIQKKTEIENYDDTIFTLRKNKVKFSSNKKARIKSVLNSYN